MKNFHEKHIFVKIFVNSCKILHIMPVKHVCFMVTYWQKVCGYCNTDSVNNCKYSCKKIAKTRVLQSLY